MNAEQHLPFAMTCSTEQSGLHSHAASNASRSNGLLCCQYLPRVQTEPFSSTPSLPVMTILRGGLIQNEARCIVTGIFRNVLRQTVGPPGAGTACSTERRELFLASVCRVSNPGQWLYLPLLTSTGLVCGFSFVINFGHLTVNPLTWENRVSS